MRQNAAKLTSIDKNQQEDRFIAEAKQDKLRYLEEVHSAQRKVSDLQTHLKILESKLAEKDTEIRLLQEKKSECHLTPSAHPRFNSIFTFLSRERSHSVCGSSFDSYNSYALTPLGYNSQASFNASNNSFNTATNTSSLLEQTFAHPSSSMASPYATSQNYATQSSSPSYKPSSVNLQAMNLSGGVGSVGNTLSAGGVGTSGGGGGGGSSTGNYSANSSNYSNNYDSNNYTQNTSSYDTSYENITRKSIDDHMKRHIDEQLLTKVSQLLAQKQREFNSTNNIILNQMQSSRELTRSCRDITNEKEEFY